MISRTKNIINTFNNFEEDYFKVSNKVYKNIDLNFNIIEFQNISFKYKKSDKNLYNNIPGKKSEVKKKTSKKYSKLIQLDS
jgi:hypothetical protein